MTDLFAITAGILFGLGVFQLLRRDLIKVGMGFYILFAAINFLFLAVGVYNGNQPAYVYPDASHGAALYLDANGDLVQDTIGTGDTKQTATPSDPLVQALILTAIVISFGSYALFLGMINESARRFKTINADYVNGLQK